MRCAGSSVETGAAGEARGGVQRSAAVAIFDIDLRAIVGEKLHDLVEALLSRSKQRTAAVAVDGLEVGAGGETELDGFDNIRLKLHAACRVGIAGTHTRRRHQRRDA